MNRESVDVQNRYASKIAKYCDGLDPYKLSENNFSRSALPKNVHYFDIIEYLIDRQSAYTRESFRAFKGLEAYKTFEAGWIQYLGSKTAKTGNIVFAKVKHSQKLNLKPTACWVAVATNGAIQAGHCDCMAGLGEACTHIAATLFALEAWSRKELNEHQQKSCTDVLNQWLVPPKRKINFGTIEEIYNYKKKVASNFEVPEATVNEIHDFVVKLSEKGELPVVAPLTIQKNPTSSPSYNEDISTKADMINLFFCQFFRPHLSERNLMQLRELGRQKILELNYSSENIAKISKLSVGQNKSWWWNKFRAGRITASVFKAVTRTSIDAPSLSLIKRICYPENFTFTTKATRYGCFHEKDALKEYIDISQKKHKNFSASTTGFHVLQGQPFFGASPDGLTKCDCCGKGVAEIKCPFCLREGTSLRTYAAQRDCPIKLIGEVYQMDTRHQYYYQVQLQMYVLDLRFCDFIIWNKKDFTVIRVLRNDLFLQHELLKHGGYTTR